MGEYSEFFYASIVGVITFLVVYFGLYWLYKYYPLPKKLFKQVFKINNSNTQAIITTVFFLTVVFVTPVLVSTYTVQSNIMTVPIINCILLGIYNATMMSLKS